jgi:hypothetical protein
MYSWIQIASAALHYIRKKDPNAPPFFPIVGRKIEVKTIQQKYGRQRYELAKHVQSLLKNNDTLTMHQALQHVYKQLKNKKIIKTYEPPQIILTKKKKNNNNNKKKTRVCFGTMNIPTNPIPSTITATPVEPSAPPLPVSVPVPTTKGVTCDDLYTNIKNNCSLPQKWMDDVMSILSKIEKKIDISEWNDKYDFYNGPYITRRIKTENTNTNTIEYTFQLPSSFRNSPFVNQQQPFHTMIPQQQQQQQQFPFLQQQPCQQPTILTVPVTDPCYGQKFTFKPSLPTTTAPSTPNNNNPVVVNIYSNKEDKSFDLKKLCSSQSQSQSQSQNNVVTTVTAPIIQKNKNMVLPELKQTEPIIELSQKELENLSKFRYGSSEFFNKLG